VSSRSAHSSGISSIRYSGRVPLKTTRSRRVIEIPPSLVAELRTHKLASVYSGEHDYVFSSRTGAGLDHRNVAGRVLARAVKKAKPARSNATA
jgi:integrase